MKKFLFVSGLLNSHLSEYLKKNSIQRYAVFLQRFDKDPAYTTSVLRRAPDFAFS